ncbi:MAG: hypothetical protein LBP59_17200 [Planctomycetaceae bacterium]|nr:hypothetical protein [Planctomycetaceae bacterium]
MNEVDIVTAFGFALRRIAVETAAFPICFLLQKNCPTCPSRPSKNY